MSLPGNHRSRSVSAESLIDSSPTEISLVGVAPPDASSPCSGNLPSITRSVKMRRTRESASASALRTTFKSSGVPARGSSCSDFPYSSAAARYLANAFSNRWRQISSNSGRRRLEDGLALNDIYSDEARTRDAHAPSGRPPSSSKLHGFLAPCIKPFTPFARLGHCLQKPLRVAQIAPSYTPKLNTPRVLGILDKTDCEKSTGG